ncbi:MAG: DJ-1/PfpI family protein [Elusimicrobiaceae bacterium]|nr:DJ-1/PfpI family protein [Elusimicrobiaceae bacterium]
MKVCMVVTNGFEEVETVGTYGILRRGGLDVDVYSLRGTQATGRFGLTCNALKDFAHFSDDNYAAIILPGGPQYKELENTPRVLQLLQDFYARGKYVCAICASPTILGHLGLLQGKKYTCFTAMNEDFGGTYCDDYAVADGQIVTGKSAAAAIDFGFAILQALRGKEIADETKADIYYK